MTTFFTGDTHFGHEGIIGPRMTRPRPFPDIRAHDEALIAAWNAVVGPGDEVFHLGDFALGKGGGAAEETFHRLNGRKILIVGNHDRQARKLPWAAQHDGLCEVTVEERRLVLFHYALRSWPRIWQGALHLFGHTHGSLPGTKRSCDVGVDAWDYRPVRLDEILAAMDRNETWPEELRSDLS